MTRFVFCIDWTVWGLPFALDISPDMGEASFLCFHLAWWKPHNVGE
jgi:hypothetical protein